MSPQTSIPVPRIPTAHDLYNKIMGEIEPELLLENVPMLKKKYVSETAGEKQKRATRYKQAFAKFQRAYTAYLTSLDADIKQFMHSTIRSAEASVREEESKQMLTLEHLISSL